MEGPEFVTLFICTSDPFDAEEYMDYILMKTDLTNKGIAIGEERKALETAKNLLRNNVSEEIIADSIGLPLEQVKALKTLKQPA